MVEIPQSLRSVFTAPLRERDGSYFIELPKEDVEHGTVSSGEVCRVALIGRVSDADSDPAASEQSDDPSANAEPEFPDPPVSEGDVREVTIKSLGDQGDGIAKVERGYVVIVPEVEPGDEPTVRIDQVNRNVAFASVVDRDSRPV